MIYNNLVIGVLQICRMSALIMNQTFWLKDVFLLTKRLLVDLYMFMTFC